MSNRKIGKKGIIIGTIVMAVASGSILASGISKWERKSLNVYETCPNQQQLKKDGNFTPKFVKELPGGYTFMMASLEKEELLDEYNKATDEGNEFTLRYYSKEDKEQVPVISFRASDIDRGFDNHEYDKVAKDYNGNTLYFYDCTHKYVSENYKPTKEEQKKMANKELRLIHTESKRLSQIPLKMRKERFQAIAWQEGDIYYRLTGVPNHQFKQKQLVSMAKAVIDVQ